MKSIKKILAILMVVMLLTAAMASCGRTNDNEDDNPPVTTESPTPEATPTVTPEATPTPSPDASNEGGTTVVEADKVLGVMEGSKYKNEYFGFSIDLPADWYKVSKEELVTIYNLSADLAKENGDAQTIDLAMQQIIPLFLTAPENPLTSVENNSGITCMAQNIKDYESIIKDSTSFLNMAVQGAMAQNDSLSFSDVETITLGGQEFGKVAGTTNVDGTDVYQNMYATLKNGYAIYLVLSGSTEEQKNELENVMNSISFE